MEIPFHNRDRLYAQYAEEINSVVQKIFSSGQVLMGPLVAEFEEKIAQYCGRKFACSVSSCTDALFFALKAADVGEGDEVLVTSFSFIASASCILRAGAIPVFVDINADDFMMDLESAKQCLSKKTKAVIGVHLFGQSLPAKEWEEFTVKHNLIFIEDAAQSLGSQFQNRRVGQMGLISCLSFDPTKVLGAFGTGGAVLTDDRKIYSILKKFRYHGKDEKNDDFEILGYNSRMTTLQAALLNLQMKWLDRWIAQRQSIAQGYTDRLKDIEGLVSPSIRLGSKHIFHKYVLKTTRRDELKKYLEGQGIAAMIHYPHALYEYGVFKKYYTSKMPLATVNKIKTEVLSLPIYPELEASEIEYIVDSIRKFYQ